MIFGEYFPNPAVFGTGPDAAALVSPLAAMLVEALGTAILVLVIFALTDPDNAAAPDAGAGAVLRRLHRRRADQPVRADHPGRLEPGPRLRSAAGGAAGRLRERRHSRARRAASGSTSSGRCSAAWSAAASYERLIGPRLPRKAAARHRPTPEPELDAQREADREQATDAVSLHPQLGPQPDGRRAAAPSRRRPFRGVLGRTEATHVRPLAIEAMAELGIDIAEPGEQDARSLPRRAVRRRHHGLRPGGRSLPGLSRRETAAALELPRSLEGHRHRGRAARRLPPGPRRHRPAHQDGCIGS